MTTDKCEGIHVATSGSVTVTGPDAIDTYRLVATRGALRLEQLGIKANRHTSRRQWLDVATGYTGIKYRGSRLGLSKALGDLTKEIERRHTERDG